MCPSVFSSIEGKEWTNFGLSSQPSPVWRNGACFIHICYRHPPLFSDSWRQCTQPQGMKHHWPEPVIVVLFPFTVIVQQWACDPVLAKEKSTWHLFGWFSPWGRRKPIFAPITLLLWSLDVQGSDGHSCGSHLGTLREGFTVKQRTESRTVSPWWPHWATKPTLNPSVSVFWVSEILNVYMD